MKPAFAGQAADGRGVDPDLLIRTSGEF